MSDTLTPKYQVYIVRDQAPRLHVKISDEDKESLVTRLHEDHNFLGTASILAKFPLKLGMEKDIQKLLEFDQLFFKGIIKYFFQELILLGINFQKNRTNTDGRKDVPDW